MSGRLGTVAERDVLNVDEHFVFGVLIPHPVAGVAGVDEDRADSELFYAILNGCLAIVVLITACDVSP